MRAAFPLAAQGAGGQRDDRGAVTTGAPLQRTQTACELVAVGAGKLDVREDEAVAATLVVVERLDGVRGGVRDEADRLELAREDLAVDRVVLHEQQQAASALGVGPRRERATGEPSTVVVHPPAVRSLVGDR